MAPSSQARAPPTLPPYHPTPTFTTNKPPSSFQPGTPSSHSTPGTSQADMFKRGGGGGAGAQGVYGPNMFSKSPVSREPLLAGASNPGVSQRLSDTSLASYDQPTSMSQRLGPSVSHSSSAYTSATERFGPTAHLAPATASPRDRDYGAVAGAGAAGGGTMALMDDDELDDQLHTFTAAEKKDLSSPFDITSWRGWANALTLAFLALALVGLFALYPILSWFYGDANANGGSTSGYNLGGINASGQYPSITGLPTLIDADTPSDVYDRTGYDGEKWSLVFSDEFNKDGRTFYDGDDPFFQAMDIHYWPTGDFEWYDPSAITTKDGHLQITLTQEPIHDLNFKSGMLQSWNKLCFNTNAYFEVSASLPGTSTIGGFWPGIWTMGNLGRPGYGASTDGMWPYSYDSCDVGTLANQTYVNGTGPDAALTTGSNGGSLSFLPGQRASACTCAGESHPGPSVDVGRSSPEIDMVEAQIQIDNGLGEVSQSFQVAPYDDFYQWANSTTTNWEITDTSLTRWNTYLGGSYQQAVSALTTLPTDIYYNQDSVGGTSKQFTKFGFEYSAYPADRSKGYIQWVSNNQKSWRMNADAVAANSKTEVGQRLVSEEPMALIFNLAMSNNFQNVDFSHLTFPNYLRIDYIRVWQRADGSGSIGCDPDDHPTADYIEQYANVYANPNLTTWEGAGYTFPKNSLKDAC